MVLKTPLTRINLPKNGALKLLRLTGHQLNHLDLTENKNLKELYVTGNQITELDLSHQSNLKKVECGDNQLTYLNVANCPNLEEISCYSNNLSSVDFLAQLSNPEKLEVLKINDNNIQPTDIKVFKPFVNLEELRIGTLGLLEDDGKRNKFYGSFKSWRNLTELKSINIEATDIDTGLEYLPIDLEEIECEAHDPNNKCQAIQNELEPLDYDLESWQAENFELVKKVREEKLQRLQTKVAGMENKMEALTIQKK